MNTRLEFLNRRAERIRRRSVDITWRHDLPQQVREQFADLDRLYFTLRHTKYPESRDCAYRECDELAGRLKAVAGF